MARPVIDAAHIVKIRSSAAATADVRTGAATASIANLPDSSLVEAGFGGTGIQNMGTTNIAGVNAIATITAAQVAGSAWLVVGVYENGVYLTGSTWPGGVIVQNPGTYSVVLPSAFTMKAQSRYSVLAWIRPLYNSGIPATGTNAVSVQFTSIKFTM